MNTAHFKGRVNAARWSGTLDTTFTFTGDFAGPSRDNDSRDNDSPDIDSRDIDSRDINIRVRAAADAGRWIFTRRDITTGTSQ